MAQRKRQSIPVTVEFRSFAASVPSFNGHGYTYLWPFPEPPAVGDRVFLGDEPGVVVFVGATESSKGLKLAEITRRATQEEVNRARISARDETIAWLDMARREAGLPTRGRKLKKPPGEFPPIPPADGNVSCEVAEGRGKVWWRAYKLAEEHGRDPIEVARFREIAGFWYSLAREPVATSEPDVPDDQAKRGALGRVRNMIELTSRAATQSRASSQPPPAWHPDPTGRHEYRYWDGSAWTVNVSDHGVVAIDPLEHDNTTSG